ncbi:MAG: LysE family translocator [Desulfovibrio sp.]|nr:LysE family translocator [Desulfovibrio sp.]
MHDVLTFLLTGTTLGLAASLTPGPLQALICVQTITHGPREGARVGMAPLFTDLPVMALCLLVLEALSSQAWLMGAISLIGGAVVMRFGWGSMTAKPVDLAGVPTQAKSWRKGLATNILNPKMILFWGTVGSPTLLAAYKSSLAAAAAFLLSFYLLLVGTNIALAWLSGRFSRFLSGPGYVWTMRVLGALLMLLAAHMVWDGLSRLGIA